MNAARAPGVAASAALQRVRRDAVRHAELGLVLGRHPGRQPAGEHEPVDHRGVRVALHHDRRAERRERQAERVVALRGAVGQEPRARGAVGLGRELLRALVRRRRLGPRSTPWMSCGMSSLSVCQPIAVRTPRSAPLPALWPGTWKRVEPRNPYATTASRYGAWGWSGEAMSAQACQDVLRGGLDVRRCPPWSSHVNTSTCRWASGRCGPSWPGPPRPGRIPASSSTPTSSSSPSPACAGRCGSRATGSWSPCPRSTTASSRRGPCSGSTTPARCAGRPTPTRSPPPSSTRTSRRRSTWLSGECPSVGAAGHCTGGHLAFRAAFDARVRGTACWYPTGLHDGKLGKDRSDALERAGEIDGELLLIFGTRDPHTPPDGREAVHARGWRARRSRGIEYDAEHAFGRDIGPRFDPEATDAAFAETVAFFRRTL